MIFNLDCAVFLSISFKLEATPPGGYVTAAVTGVLAADVHPPSLASA